MTKTIREILEPFILDDKNHLYSHNAEYLIKQLEDNQIEFGKKLLELAADKCNDTEDYRGEHQAKILNIINELNN
jgi:hypothetical protein